MEAILSQMRSERSTDGIEYISTVTTMSRLGFNTLSSMFHLGLICRADLMDVPTSSGLDDESMQELIREVNARSGRKFKSLSLKYRCCKWAESSGFHQLCDGRADTITIVRGDTTSSGVMRTQRGRAVRQVFIRRWLFCSASLPPHVARDV